MLRAEVCRLRDKSDKLSFNQKAFKDNDDMVHDLPGLPSYSKLRTGGFLQFSVRKLFLVLKEDLDSKCPHRGNCRLPWHQVMLQSSADDVLGVVQREWEEQREKLDKVQSVLQAQQLKMATKIVDLSHTKSTLEKQLIKLIK
ncbi:hypothetical protein MHYP_G00084720 [Metynnis hypsauchen]